MISSWAAEEAARACFKDKRLNQRMAMVLSTMGDKPNLSIPAACQGKAEMHAAYRFFDNDKVTFEKVLSPHAQQSLQRMSGEKVVVLAQDTTEVDLTRPDSVVEGVGTLDGVRKGLLLHVMHAFTPAGTPLGTVWGKWFSRSDSKPSHRQDPQRRKQTPIEQKESLRWLSGLRKAREIAGAFPAVRCICVADSEADIYECLAEPRNCPSPAGQSPVMVDWLVRGCYDRTCQCDDDTTGIREQVLATAVLDRAPLPIRGRKTKIAVEKDKRHQKRKGRVAQIEIRAATVMLQPPRRPDRQLPPVQVHVVLVSEVNAPVGEEPIEWLLLTTLPINTLEQVRTIIQYYCLRWNIEILFRTLKSGCRIEERRFEHIDRVLPALALYLIVAWRTLLVCRLGRECPDADCETLFEPSEWKAVWVTIHRKKPPKQNPSLRQMVHLVAQLGGYVERKNGEPGPQTIWIGLQRTYDLALAWDTFGPEARRGS